MSRAELADRIEHLSQDDFQIVVSLVDRLLENNEFPRLSEDQLVKELSDSVHRSDEGYTKPAYVVSEEMRAKYAV